MARDVTVRFRGEDNLSSTTNKIGDSFSRLGGQIANASGAADRSPGVFAKLGSALGGVATVAGGIIAANLFGKIVDGLGAFFRAGLDAVGSSQLLEQRLNALFAANQLYTRQTTTSTETTYKSAEAMAAEQAAMEANIAKRDLLSAKIQEQKQRIWEMANKWTDAGLATQKAQAQLSVMEQQLTSLDSEIARGVSSIDDISTITRTQWVKSGKSLVEVQAAARAESEKLVRGMEALARQSPFPTEEIKNIGAYGVQMGMSADEALEFTSTMTNLGLALGLPAHEIIRMSQNLKQMQGMAKLTTIDMREMERRGFDLAKVLEVEMGMTVEEFNAKLATSPELFDQLLKSINTFSQNTFGDVIGQMSQTLPALMGNLQDTFVLGARDLLRPIVEAIAPFAADFINEFGAFMDATMPMLGRKAVELFGQAWAAVAGAGGAASGLTAWVDNAIANLPEMLNGLLAAVTAWFSGSGADLQQSVHAWVTAFWNWVVEAGSEVGTRLAALLGQIWNWAASGDTQAKLNELGFVLGQRLVDGLAMLFEDQAALVAILGKLVTGLAAAAGAIGGILIMVGGQIVAGIISGILDSLGVDLKPALVTELGGILSGIWDNLKTIVNVLGRDIVLGVSQGLLDGIDQLTTTLDQIGQIIVYTVKDLLGIASPSSVFAEIGGSIIMGLVNGITENLSGLLGVLGEVGKTLLSGLFGGGDGGGDAMQIDFTALLTTLTQTLPEAITALGEMFTLLWAAVTAQIMTAIVEAVNPFILLLVQTYAEHVPTLQAGWEAMTTVMVSTMTPVHAAMQTLVGLLAQATAAVQELATKFKSAMEQVRSSIASAMDKIRNLIELVQKAEVAFTKMAEAAERAARAARSAGSGAPGGGFQRGTGLAPMRIPGSGGRPFSLPVHAGELVSVQPAGAARQQNRGGGVVNNYWTVNITAPSTDGVGQSLQTLIALSGGAA